MHLECLNVKLFFRINAFISEKETLSIKLDFKNLSQIRPKPTSEDKWAAVSIIIDESKNSVLVAKRTERDDDPWSGDVVFPGGKYIAADGDLVNTAIRETLEETGIDLGNSQFRGVMEVHRPSNSFSIKVLPVVFTVKKIDGIKINRDELVSVYWLPLDLHDAVLIRQKMKGIYDNWTILYNGIVIWGMTYRIYKSLLENLKLGNLPWEDAGESS